MRNHTGCNDAGQCESRLRTLVLSEMIYGIICHLGAMEMSRATPISTRSSGHNGASLPPRAGGGGDGRGRDGLPDFVPNYGERLRRARLGLAVAMTPILMLFISFTAVYLVR